jgi:adenine-specific DNA-methyltransferase
MLPHRVLSTSDENQDGALTEQEGRKQQDFAAMILQNLKKAGVQNTRKGERLTFDRLDPYAGAWLHAAGDYTDADGKTRRVAVSIGPEHGTVGPQQVKEATKEAVQGVGFDMLVVCGFAFDPHVAEEAKRYGKLTVLPAKMNPDLAMGDELLKKTGAGNLFMVFGEPDVDINKRKNGQLVATLKGVDVYDPTTGQIRSASTDDIACWFIDTNYNGRELLRAPCLLYRSRRTLRQAQTSTARGDRRISLEQSLQHGKPPIRQARNGQVCRQGHQPLRRRSFKGL